MKKKLGGLALLAALGGCGPSQQGAFMSHVGPGGVPMICPGGSCGSVRAPATIPGLVGPRGEPVTVRAAARPETHLSPAEQAARATFAQGLPPEVVQQVLYKEDVREGANILQAGAPPGVAPPGGFAPPGIPPLPRPLPPVPPVGSGAPGAVAAVGARPMGGPRPFPVQRTSVRFTAPIGMKVSWYVPGPDGRPEIIENALAVPGRYNFLQGALYRLKLSGIPGAPPGLELYPTLEVVPANNRTATFLAHSSVPLGFTPEDFQQVIAGNYLVKVVYLPYPQFQDLAFPAPGVLISSRLEPGVDPIAEARRRGTILLVVRLGNIDLEAPNTPAMDAPSPYQPKRPPPRGLVPGMPRPGTHGFGMVPGRRGPRMPPGMPRGMPTALPRPGTRPPAGPLGAVGKMPAVRPVGHKEPATKGPIRVPPPPGLGPTSR